jgi:hypothetical protein
MMGGSGGIEAALAMALAEQWQKCVRQQSTKKRQRL